MKELKDDSDKSSVDDYNSARIKYKEASEELVALIDKMKKSSD